MFIGIDLGTSAVKAILVDDDQRILASATVALAVSRPQPLWSEQDPDAWVRATLDALAALREAQPAAFRAVRGIGLSGQMHGAVLLDETDRPLRPCILWNDGRSGAQCREMETAEPRLRAITGNIAMPGFTAPKLAWVRANEPDTFARTRSVLLPKAYLRLALTGEAVEDMSDAAGTLWLDVGARRWSEPMLSLTGLSEAQMPRLTEGSAPAGRMRAELAASLGFDTPPLFAGGAGDNAAGAVGLGAIRPGDAFVSLGTSGVLWLTTDRFRPNPDRAVHAFCHALPGLWHRMTVHLSAASCLAWWAGVTGAPETSLLAPLGEAASAPSPVLFAPYLSGERTPHNDPAVRGAFAGLGHEHDRAAMTQAVLEGVAFAFRDGLEAMRAGGGTITEADVIGGGARSRVFVHILSQVLGLPLHRLADGETGGAFGAARLARLAVTSEDPTSICRRPTRIETVLPDRTLSDAYSARHARWKRLYPALKEL